MKPIPVMTAGIGKFPAAEDTLEAYLAYFPSFDLLTWDEERFFTRIAQLGDVLGRDRLVMHNIRLVASQAFRYFNARMPDNTQVVTVISEGIFGLMRAVERFDPERGYRFSTYATHWIRRFIFRGSSGLRFIRLPHYVHGILVRLPNVQAELEKKKGRPPTVAEIARKLKEREGAYHLAMHASHSTNIVKPINTEESTEDGVTDDYMDSCNQDPNAVDPLDSLIKGEMKDRLMVAVNRLPDRDKGIIKMRYGIGYPKAYTLQEIGVATSLSRERVRQIERECIANLQENFAELQETEDA